MENIKELFLEGEAFDDARQKFNVVLQRLFKSMIDTGSQDGSISLKLDVSVKSEWIPNNDPDIEDETREVKLPEFSYKVNSSITVKDEQKGNNNPQMELVWDDENQKYVLQYVANTSQRSIFDKDFQEQMSGADEEPQTGGTPLLTGETPALPGGVAGESDGEILDADYREVTEDSETTEEQPEKSGEEPEEEPAEDVGEDKKYFSDDESDSDYSYDDPES